MKDSHELLDGEVYKLYDPRCSDLDQWFAEVDSAVPEPIIFAPDSIWIC